MYSARSERNPREFPITDQGRADQGVFENSFPPSARPTKWDAHLTESNFQARSRACLKIKICTKHMFY